jgi:serine/threonine protein phosphatase PrpC
MHYLVSLKSDMGIKMDTNQDCCLVYSSKRKYDGMAFAIVCDGMGGLTNGEIASNTVVGSFKKWLYDFIEIAEDFSWGLIQVAWFDLIEDVNKKLLQYGRKNGFRLGTTLTAALFVGDEFLAVNVGDSRLYRVTQGSVDCITKDHTLVAQEVRNGVITQEEAENDPRRNILLQCIGGSDEVYPDFFSGKVNSDEVYFICSDGFRHEITTEEIKSHFSPDSINDKETMQSAIEYLINVNKSRLEKDNISVVMVKTVDDNNLSGYGETNAI